MWIEFVPQAIIVIFFLAINWMFWMSLHKVSFWCLNLAFFWGKSITFFNIYFNTMSKKNTSIPSLQIKLYFLFVSNKVTNWINVHKLWLKYQIYTYMNIFLKLLANSSEMFCFLQFNFSKYFICLKYITIN